MEWNKLADENSIAVTVKALNANGFSTIVVENGKAARQKALELIPKGAEVFTITSATVDSIGLANDLNESGNFDSVRKKLHSMDSNTQKKEMVKLVSSADWAVGSVHAITQNGEIFVASASGSQIPPYSYGSSHVIMVVGTQKIVKDMDQAMKRIYEYSLPLESERAKKAYGASGSVVAKLLILNKEFIKDRMTVILIKEELGF